MFYILKIMTISTSRLGQILSCFLYDKLPILTNANFCVVLIIKDILLIVCIKLYFSMLRTLNLSFKTIILKTYIKSKFIK